MSFVAWWFAFLVPASVLSLAWRAFFVATRTGNLDSAAVVCLSFASGSNLLAIGALAWVGFVRPIAPENYSVEAYGLFLALVGMIAAIGIRAKRRSYFGLGLGASAWLLLLFGLMSMSV